MRRERAHCSRRPHINRATLRAKGFDDDAIARFESALPGAFELPFVFNKFVLGEEFCKEKLGFADEQLNDWNLVACCATASASQRNRSKKHQRTSAGA